MKRNLVGKILGKIKIFVQDFVTIRTALRAKNRQQDTLTRTTVTTKTATWADIDHGESGVGDDIDGCDEEVVTSDLEDHDEVESTFYTK